jgi:peptide deformylase
MLRRKCAAVAMNYPGLEKLIADMWETLYTANGCGLAAPQVDVPIKLFLVDSLQTYEHADDEERKTFFDGDSGVRETFINARIISRSDEIWTDDEGCLSIPGIYQPIERSWTIIIEYLDKEFTLQTKTFKGITARMIQHEFDHTEGILHLDYLKPLTRKLLQSKLTKISKGKLKAPYPMRYLR